MYVKCAKSCSIPGKILFLNSKLFLFPEKGVLQKLVSHLRWTAWWHVLKPAKENGCSASGGPALWVWLLPLQCLVGTDRVFPSSSLPLPSNILSGHKFHITLTITCFREQATTLLVVSSLCQPTMSSQICQNYSTEVKALPDQPASAGLLHLPLSGHLFSL